MVPNDPVDESSDLRLRLVEAKPVEPLRGHERKSSSEGVFDSSVQHDDGDAPEDFLLGPATLSRHLADA